MAATSSNQGWGRREQKTNDDDDIDDDNTEKRSPGLVITKIWKNIFNDEIEDNYDGKDGDEGSDRGASWINEKRKKDYEIAMLKRKIKTLETTLKDMWNTSRVTVRDKAGWTGDELISVKDINNFSGRGFILRRNSYGSTKWLEGDCTFD